MSEISLNMAVCKFGDIVGIMVLATKVEQRLYGALIEKIAGMASDRVKWPFFRYLETEGKYIAVHELQGEIVLQTWIVRSDQPRDGGFKPVDMT